VADLKYEFLDANARVQASEQRLRGLEQQHYEQRLNLIVAKNPDEVSSARGQIDVLEKDIKALRDESKAVSAEAKAESEAPKS